MSDRTRVQGLHPTGQITTGVIAAEEFCIAFKVGTVLGIKILEYFAKMSDRNLKIVCYRRLARKVKSEDSLENP